MDLSDTGRVRRPRDGVEYRLGTVTAITYAPYSTYIRRLRLRFSSGDERPYTTTEIIACTRDDDRAALVAAVTEACRSLRDTCRIAHDYNDDLGANIRVLLSTLVATAQARLGVTIEPDGLPDQPDHPMVTDPYDASRP